MSKKSNDKKELESSWAPTPEELVEQQEKEAEKLLEESTNPNAPLFQKLDAVITAINGATHQLCRIADKMTGVSTSVTVTPAISTPSKEKQVSSKEQPTPTPQLQGGISDAVDLFPDDLAEKLNFLKLEDGTIKVAPREFLGSENFAKIASIIRAAGGAYKSAGKESHFLIFPTKADAERPSTPATEAEKIEARFPPLLADLLTFTEKDGKVIVKARQFLGSDNFAKIAGIIREVGGDYISAGKDSRFEVPIK